jgi:hypothetical protein
VTDLGVRLLTSHLSELEVLNLSHTSISALALTDIPNVTVSGTVVAACASVFLIVYDFSMWALDHAVNALGFLSPHAVVHAIGLMYVTVL